MRITGAGSSAIPLYRTIGDEAANRELVDIRRDTGMVDLFGQTVHPAREDRTEGTTEQVSAPVRLDLRPSGRPGPARRPRSIPRSNPPPPDQGRHEGTGRKATRQERSLQLASD